MFYLVFLIIVIIIIYIYIIRPHRDEWLDQPKIPLIEYRTGPFAKSKIPNDLQDIMNISSKNLNTTIQFFGDNDCLNFISKHFSKQVLKAYNSIIPGAYKADLFRLCVLYIHGGIYLDLSHQVLRPYNINQTNADMILVKDRNSCGYTCCIQFSFMATIPKNNFLKFVISNISNDVLLKKKGKCALDFTGPCAFGRYFLKFFSTPKIYPGLYKYKGLDGKIYIIDVPFYQGEHNHLIEYTTNKNVIKTKGKNHNKYLYKTKKIPHYSSLWKKNQLFK